MLKSEFDASTRTGFAPVFNIPPTVALNVFATVITSSPEPIPLLINESSKAERPS